jgi:hypothetical protein
MNELRDLPFNTSYQVSQDGRVWSKGREISIGPNRRSRRTAGNRWLYCRNKSYPRVSIWSENKRKLYVVAYLVAYTWIGPPPPNHRLHYKDGMKSNIHYTNLEWRKKGRQK